MSAGSMLMPSVRYQDAPAAIAWLVDVLGFTRQVVYDGPDGTVAHAQLTFGETGMVMLGSATNASLHPELNALPAEIGGRNTTAMYLVVADCGPLWQRVDGRRGEGVDGAADDGLRRQGVYRG